MGQNKQAIYQNQNEVRMAVHVFLSMEDLDGDIGPQAAEIAKQFNNSVRATIRAEERISARSGFVRFFAGGDEEAALEMQQLTIQNMERIQKLHRIIGECDSDDETRLLLQEQLSLQNITQSELQDKGILGWLLK